MSTELYFAGKPYGKYNDATNKKYVRNAPRSKMFCYIFKTYYLI